MLNNVDLDVLRKLQLLGLDQTANLGRYFGGADKIVELAKIDFYKERVLDGAFYLSQKDSEYLVADMLGGDVYKVSMSQYLLSAHEDGITVTDMVTDEEVELIVDGKLSWGCLNHFGRDNYTMVSSDSGRGFKGYPAVRFGNSYNKSIRVHWLIVLMDVGIQAVELCVGEFRTHEIHHIVPIGSGGTNSIENLVIMRKSDHEELHGYYRGKRE